MKVRKIIPAPLRPGDLRFLSLLMQFPRVRVHLGGRDGSVAEQLLLRLAAALRPFEQGG